ncbi:MAG TPA: hypothetical protein VMD53_10390 [Rhizomicrobium sp.]|nr:hypothetical protein [Rhizomicrobium sp.]
MPEAVGSTFGGGFEGIGGLIFFVLYLVLGPGAVIFHSTRWAFHRYSLATQSHATLGYNDLETIRQCLPWNVIIAMIPAIPYVFALFGK